MSVRKDILDWIVSLSRPRAAFNGIATCPYANTADLDIIETVSYNDFIIKLLRSINNFRFNCNHVDIIVPSVSKDHGDIWLLSEELNKILAKKDLITYVSDPTRPFVVDGVQTTNEKHLFIILQQISELAQTSAHLWRKGYYANWPTDMFDKIVLPRSVKQ